MGKHSKAGSVADWADSRLGLAGLGRKLIRKVFPDHWSFMLGEIALWSFVVLLLTGVFLTLWFKPSSGETVYTGSYAPLRGLKVSDAYASTLHISFDVRGGLLMRQVHHWAANFFIAAMFVHMMRVFVTGAFRRPREINWMIGATMLLLGILEGFAGYSLPDDLLSGTGLRIAEGLMQSIPVVGSYVVFFVFGGPFPGDAITHRLFIAHVLLIPGLLLALIGAHMMILVYQKHTQWPGPGKSNQNVVGFPMLPVYAAKSGGYFFITFGVTTLMAAVLTINPVWLYGPYDPSMVTADSQPDWYMGLPEGLLRIMPGWETHLWGHTISWNVLLPGVVMPMLLFVTFVAYPFVAAWVSGDQREHHLLQRPRDAPNRTAFLAAMVTLYGLLWAAGGNDVIALLFHLDVNTEVETFRAAVFIGPVVAFMVARRWCLGLQRQDREQVLHGYETGVIVRSPDGGYSERHARLPVEEAYTITAVDGDVDLPVAHLDPGGRPPSRAERRRLRLAPLMFGDSLPRLSAQEVQRSGFQPGSGLITAAGQSDDLDGDGDGDGDDVAGSDTEGLAADGHQYDGRHAVAGDDLRSP